MEDVINTRKEDLWAAAAKFVSQNMTDTEKDNFVNSIGQESPEEKSILRDAGIIFGISSTALKERFDALDAFLWKGKQ